MTSLLSLYMTQQLLLPGHVEHVAGENVVRVLRQLMVEDRPCQPIHRGRGNSEEQETPDQLQCPIDAFDHQAHTE